MKRIMENTGKNMTCFNAALVVPAMLLFFCFGIASLHAGGGSDTSGSASRSANVNTNDIRDYICIVNRYVHPNMERYLNTTINNLIAKGDEDSDNYAATLEAEKRGGFGSGFVYVDSSGNNFIITNYHVIVGAYRLSVTFESESGEKTVIKNLSILSVDEQEDLAILAFPSGQKPFRRGVPISNTQLRSGSRVAAAGYPGISHVPTWNLYFGNVGNPRVTPPGQSSPFIQHDAAINPGNSGGPLLIEDRQSPMGYGVVGVNTMQIKALQGANYAITTERLNVFLQKSFRQIGSLEDRIGVFMELLERSTTSVFVYKDLSSFLSSTMINANPEGTLSRLPNGMEDIWNKIIEDPVVGIAWAVAYIQIENQIYSQSRNTLARAIGGMPEVLSVEQNNMGGYTARLLIKGYPYRTEWINEYNTWKLDDFMEDSGEYNDYYQLANPHPLGKKVIYSLSSARDYDWYTIEVPRAGRLTVRTEGNIDPELTISNDPSIEINRERSVSNDDYPNRGYNAQVSMDVRAGTVWVYVNMAGGNAGEYVLLAGLDGEIDNIPLIR